MKLRRLLKRMFAARKPPHKCDHHNIVKDWAASWEDRLVQDGALRLAPAVYELIALLDGGDRENIGFWMRNWGLISFGEHLKYYASWRCEICAIRRPDKFISVAVHEFKENDTVVFTRNVKYCNDVAACAIAASQKSEWECR